MADKPSSNILTHCFDCGRKYYIPVGSFDRSFLHLIQCGHCGKQLSIESLAWTLNNLAGKGFKHDR